MRAISVDPRDLEQHRTALTGHCYRMMGSPSDADDAVQETLVRAWKALDRFERAALRQSIRLAFVAALQRLPPKQRATLILAEVMGWSAAEIADCLDTSVAAVNSALQRARATLGNQPELARHDALTETQQQLLARYLDAFERYDVDALVSLLHEDATLSMPPYTLWLQGPQTIASWLTGRGCGCNGSRLVPTAANGLPAFAQYRPDPNGGHSAWALIVLELRDDRIQAWNAFLDVEHLFPLFGVPMHLPADR